MFCIQLSLSNLSVSSMNLRSLGVFIAEVVRSDISSVLTARESGRSPLSLDVSELQLLPGHYPEALIQAQQLLNSMIEGPCRSYIEQLLQPTSEVGAVHGIYRSPEVPFWKPTHVDWTSREKVCGPEYGLADVVRYGKDFDLHQSLFLSEMQSDYALFKTVSDILHRISVHLVALSSGVESTRRLTVGSEYAIDYLARPHWYLRTMQSPAIMQNSNGDRISDNALRIEATQANFPRSDYVRRPSTTLGGLRCWSRSRKLYLSSLANCSGRSLKEEAVRFTDLVKDFYAALPQNKYLIYSCTWLQGCGGTGDRLHGIIQSFLLSLLLKRRFMINMPSPVSLSTIFTPANPHFVDWRAYSTPIAALHFDYIDRCAQLESDLVSGKLEVGGYAASHEYITISANHYLPHLILDLDSFPIPELRGIPFLFGKIFKLLFRPTPWLESGARRIISSANGPLLGIHFRAGSAAGQTWIDPPRHELSELHKFFACAVYLEQDLKLGDNTRWLLSSDVDSSILKRYIETIPDSIRFSSKIIYIASKITHIDRSRDLYAEIIEGGFITSWASWWLLSQNMEALVLSRSGFGDTAAMAGELPASRVAFYDQCVLTDFA